MFRDKFLYPQRYKAPPSFPVTGKLNAILYGMFINKCYGGTMLPTLLFDYLCAVKIHEAVFKILFFVLKYSLLLLSTRSIK